MKIFFRIFFGCALLVVGANAIAADNTPAPGTTVCKWVGDTKTCTTYKQGKKVYDAGFLRPEEVKQCLLDKRALAATDAKLRADKAAFDPESAKAAEEEKAMQQRSAEIQLQANMLAEQRKALDAANSELGQYGAGSAFAPGASDLERYQQKLNAQNQKITAFNALSDAQKKRIDEFNAALKEHRAHVEQHNKAAEEINARVASLATAASGFDKRCTQAKSYNDDIKAAEAAIARDDAAQAK